MTDKEIIKKAKKVVKEMGLNYNSKAPPTINRITDKLLFEAYPEFSKEFLIHFTSRQPDGRGGGFTITVDVETNELLTLITKNNTYEIPDELK